MDRKELEELWRSRVAETKLRFEYARNRTDAAVGDFTLDGTRSDGRCVFRSAIRLESAALGEYNRIMRIYGDLVDRGIVPDEDDWQRYKYAGASGSTD